jgi:hypothetical protein
MRRLGNVGAAFAALMLAAPASAQAPAPGAAVDPAALKALQDMGAYLRSVRAFQVRAVTTDEDVLEDGQKVQYEGTADIVARMPNGVRAEVANDRHERLWLYDGKSFTLYGRRPNLYATIPAPPTVGLPAGCQAGDLPLQAFGFSLPPGGFVHDRRRGRPTSRCGLLLPG